MQATAFPFAPLATLPALSLVSEASPAAAVVGKSFARQMDQQQRQQQRQQQQQQQFAVVRAATGIAASAMMHATHAEPASCPCCGGSCERDAREIFKGRGAAYGSEEAVGKVSVVCIGDSITSGVGASQPGNPYPAQLQKMLGDRYIVSNLGACGAAMQRCSDSPYRKRLQWQAAQKVHADIVIIMLGTNDARPPNWHGANRALQYGSDYQALVDVLRADKHDLPIHMVIPPPVYGGAPFDCVRRVVNEILPVLIPKLSPIIGAAGSPINAFEALGGKALARGDLFDDHCHPNDLGYLHLAHVILQGIGLDAVPPEARHDPVLVTGAEPSSLPRLPSTRAQQQQRQKAATLQHGPVLAYQQLRLTALPGPHATTLSPSLMAKTAHCTAFGLQAPVHMVGESATGIVGPPMLAQPVAATPPPNSALQKLRDSTSTPGVPFPTHQRQSGIRPGSGIASGAGVVAHLASSRTSALVRSKPSWRNARLRGTRVGHGRSGRHMGVAQSHAFLTHAATKGLPSTAPPSVLVSR